MDTAITVEFRSDTKEHRKQLAHQLQQVPNVDVGVVEPKGANAPAIVAIGFKHKDERVQQASQQVAQILYDFLHIESAPAGQKQIFLLTIEAERIDIKNLSVEEIQQIVQSAEVEEYE